MGETPINNGLLNTPIKYVSTIRQSEASIIQSMQLRPLTI